MGPLQTDTILISAPVKEAVFHFGTNLTISDVRSSVGIGGRPDIGSTAHFGID
jgi:hypothetical protein